MSPAYQNADRFPASSNCPLRADVDDVPLGVFVFLSAVDIYVGIQDAGSRYGFKIWVQDMRLTQVFKLQSQ